MRTIKFLACSLVIASGVVLTSCGDDDSSSLPPIGGYNSADEVGSSDLIAYWPLNGSGVESKSNTNPSNSVNATWVEGIKGQGVNLNAGYLNYPSITDLNIQTGNITVSCWAKMTNTKLTATSDGMISPLVSFSGGSNAVGNLSLFGNTHGLVSSDSIQMKAQYGFKRPDGTEFGGDCVNMTKMEPWMITDNANGATPPHAAFANKIGGKWAHIVFTWESSTGTARMYVNGVKISNPQWEVRNQGNAMPMAFFTPSHPVIGALDSFVTGASTDVWNKPLKGQVDEIRVWKKTLSSADINALYELERAGR